jgi:hypothetical protein
MIIQVSDDESNGSDMDIDDDQAIPDPPVVRQAPGTLTGLPRRPAQAETASSIMSTSGPQTPSSSARTGEMTSKEKELAAMKLTLKKKLAEQKRVREAAAAAATPKSLPPKPPAQALPAKMVSSAQTTASPSLKRNQPVSSDTNNPVDRKRRRRTEIQEQLPSLDDEIATNEAEMARIAKDLERLKANNDRILQDKQRLTKELEELGIDTEGMSHAELRATKHDIERAMSPDVDQPPQAAVTTSQSLTNGKRPSASDVIERMTSIEDQSKFAPSPALGQTGQYAHLPGLGQASGVPKDVIQSRLPSSKAVPPPEPELTNRNVPIAAATVVETRGSATPMDDEEDFYSPPPQLSFDGQNESMSAPVSQVQVAAGDDESALLSEEGEVDMSESSEDEEDEYEPEEPQEARGVEEPQAPVPNSPSQSSEDEGAYEPPDVDEQMADSQTDNTADDTPNQLEAGDDAMDIASSSSEDSDESDSDSEQESSPEPEIEQAHATDRVQQSANAANDLAPELQSNPTFELAPVEPTPEAVCRQSHRRFR